MSGINPINNDYSWLSNSTNSTKKKDSIAKLWEQYGSMQSNANNSTAGLSEINANLKALLESYDTAKTAFNSELKENMDALSKSAAQVKSYNFNVAKEGAITTSNSTDENGNTVTTTTYSKELQAALNTVEDFLSDYNSSIKFFKDNASLSNRVENLAKDFGDTIYRAANYESIGLIVNSDGSFTVNEDQLAAAIVNNPNKVSSVLGKDGLASKAESHIDIANSQSDKLFPTIEAMFGDQLKTAIIYTGKAYASMVNYANMGNLINTML